MVESARGRDRALFTHPIHPFLVASKSRNQRFTSGLACDFNASQRDPTAQDQIAGLLVRVQSGEPA